MYLSLVKEPYGIINFMGNFNRSRSGEGRGFERRGFSSKGGPSTGWNDRGRRGPAEMHQAVCDNCRKNCEVPFRPTSGKPVFCSSCFEGSKGSSNDRQMFDAVCDECRNSCQVPFQPTSGKPIYCSNCFGEKKGAGNRENGQSQLQYKEQFEVLNNKLDRILTALTPVAEINEVKKSPAKKKSLKV